MKSFIVVLAIWVTINGSHCLQRDDGSVQGCWVPDHRDVLVIPNDENSPKDQSQSAFHQARPDHTSSPRPVAATDALSRD